MIRLSAMVLLGVLALDSAAKAAQIGVGSTRDEVVAELGEPVGRSSAGAREVLSYPGGRVFLREGRVEEIDAALTSAEPAAPAPVATPATAAEKPPAPKPAPAPPVVEVPAASEARWIKPAIITVFLCVILLLGRHWMRVAMRAQAEKKRDLLSR